MKLIDAILANGEWKIEVVHLNNEGNLEFNYYSQTEVSDQVKSLATKLNGTGNHIGVLLPQSLEFVVAALAVLLSGNVFIPMTMTWQPAQLRTVISNAEICLLLTDPSTWDDVESTEEFDDVFRSIPCRFVLEDVSGDRDTCVVTDDRSVDYCYVLYSSGSTGTPKGVCGSEQSILNRCHWIEQTYTFSSSDKIAFTTIPVFVDSIWQMFGPLLYGITQVIVPKEVLSQPSVFWSVISESSVTHLVSVPTILRALFTDLDLINDSISALHKSKSLKMLISSGEPLDFKLAKFCSILVSLDNAVCLLIRLIREYLSSDCLFLNLYGCTEVAGDSTVFEIPANLEPFSQSFIPVGFPIANTCVLVLTQDDNSAKTGLRPLSIGAVGEVFLAGEGLCKGYYNYQSKEQCFFQFSARDVQSWISAGAGLVSTDWQWTAEDIAFFKTGDLASISSHGLEFVRRNDDIIKIKGIRVDPLHIEDTIRNHQAVVDAAVHWWPPKKEDHDSLGGLAAYIVPNQDVQNPTLSIREYLNKQLSNESVPQWIIPLIELPKTASGKLLRSQLPHPGSSGYQWTVFREQDVLFAFQSVLGRDFMEPTDDFFAFGGDSKALVELSQILKIDLMLIQIYPTSRLLTGHLNGQSCKRKTPKVVSTDPGDYRFIHQLRRSVPHYQLVYQADHGLEAEANVERESRIEQSCKRKKTSKAGNEAFERSSLVDIIKKWKASSDLEAACWIMNPSQAVCKFTPSGQLTLQQEEPLPTEQTGILKISPLWSGEMQECVDGHLTIVHFVFSSEQGSSMSLVLATCHGGRVTCFDAFDGFQYWSSTIDGRAEFGGMMSTGLKVLVPSSHSTVFVLELEKGEILSRIHLEGTVRAPVVMDPWKGALWLITSNPNYLICLFNDIELIKYPTDGQITSSISFSCKTRQMIYTSLTGKVVALRCKFSPTMAIHCEQEWMHCANAPIFGSPCCFQDVCLVSTVAGTVSCIDLQGRLKWKKELEVQVYSKIIVLDIRNGPWVLISSQQGCLFLLDMSQGTISVSIDLTLGPISRPPVLLNLLSYPENSVLLSLVVMSTAGILTMISIKCQRTLASDCTLLTLHCFDGEVFSPLISFNDCLLFGCRDNNVHCLELSCNHEI